MELEKYGGERMDKEIMKGSIDILLLALLSKNDKYGYEMAKEIRAKSDEMYQMGEGTLYPALKRMEQKGWITSYWNEDLDTGRRKYYSLTEEGKSVLTEKLSHWNQVNGIIMNVLEGFS
jgi:PadR family transcriptional regulator, regulatory protein PadR